MEVGFLWVNVWLLSKGCDSFGGRSEHRGRRGRGREGGRRGGRLFTTGDWADCGLVVEADPLCWGLGTQCSENSRGRCCTVHNRDSGIPAGFGTEVHPG